MNDAVRARLSPEDLNHYFVTLYGETAASVAQVEASGEESHDDFARGGCQAKAMTEVGSIWTIPRKLQPALDSLGKEVSKAAGDKYAQCTAESGIDAASPGTVEGKLEGLDPYSEQATKIESTYEKCTPVWRESYAENEARLSAGFVAANQDVLDEAAKRYGRLADSAAVDQSFRTYLGQALALVPPQVKPAG